MKISWQDIKNITSQRFKCGYCGAEIATNIGWSGQVIQDNGQGTAMKGFIAICHNCFNPTFIDYYRKQYPGIPFGSPINSVDNEQVRELYEEARKCVTINSYTSCVLSCRKLLMNIAVAKGANQGLSFVEYVEYLSQKGYVPPDGKDWVDHIRKKGNEANHEIAIMNKEDAEELLGFVEMLLKFIYEFPAKMKSKTASKTVSS